MVDTVIRDSAGNKVHVGDILRRDVLANDSRLVKVGSIENGLLLCSNVKKNGEPAKRGGSLALTPLNVSQHWHVAGGTRKPQGDSAERLRQAMVDGGVPTETADAWLRRAKKIFSK